MTARAAHDHSSFDRTFVCEYSSFTRHRTVAEFGPPVCSVREMELLASVGVPPVDIGDDPLWDIRALRSPLLVVQRRIVRHRAGL